VVKWILSSRTHQAKGRKRKRTEPKVNYKEVGTLSIKSFISLRALFLTLQCVCLSSFKDLSLSQLLWGFLYTSL
ncbi:hypothetical protein GOODEAATRI_014045, partial [Goodea atripinnis]